MKRKGISIPSLMAIGLTVLVLVGYGIVYASFHTDADVSMRTKKVAGILMGQEAWPTAEPKMSVATVELSTEAPAAYTRAVSATTQPLAAREITLTLAGTAAFESDISDGVYDKTRLMCDYQNILAGLANAIQGDVRIVSLSQGMNAAEGKKYTDQLVHAAAAEELRAAGFNVAVVQGGVLANGAQCALDTADNLTRNGIISCGINGQQYAQTVILEVNGIRMGVIGYNEQLSNRAASALQSTAGQDILSILTKEELLQAVKDAKNQGCQCVVVYYHWNVKDTAAVTNTMKETAKELTAAGADIIVGTGPSRLLPPSRIRTADDNGVEREALVLYSMGTLLSESREELNIAGALAHVKIRAQGSGIDITALSYTPTYIWKQTVQGKDQFRVINSSEAAPAEMAGGQINKMKNSKTKTDKCMADLHLLTTEE